MSLTNLSRRAFLWGTAALSGSALLSKAATPMVPITESLAPEVLAPIIPGPITHTISMFTKGIDPEQLIAKGWNVQPSLMPSEKGWYRISRGVTSADYADIMHSEAFEGVSGPHGLYISDGTMDATEKVVSRWINIKPQEPAAYGVQIEENFIPPSPYSEPARTNLVKNSGYDWRAEQRNKHRRLK